jgi:hypothetical protein
MKEERVMSEREGRGRDTYVKLVLGVALVPSGIARKILELGELLMTD